MSFKDIDRAAAPKPASKPAPKPGTKPGTKK